MIPGRRDSLAARVERIEHALAEPVLAGPLSRHEQRELLELERERAARFPIPIDDMDLHELRDLMAWHAGDGHGSARRLDQLRQRTRPPEEIAEERAIVIAIDAMSADVLAEFMAEMSCVEPDPSSHCRPEPAKGERR